MYASRSLPRMIGVLVGVAALAGCGTDADREQVAVVTTRFYAALEAHRGADACLQLSSALRKTLRQEHSTARCADAVAKLGARKAAVEAVRVYATSARVDLAGDESVFLGLMRDGWRIDALGCRPGASGPYDCDERG